MKENEHSGCIWSDCIKFCKTMQNAAIPIESQWPYLILYLRGLKNNSFLSEMQKVKMQELLVQLFQEKDFSAERFERVSEEVHFILISPYQDKINEFVREADDLTKEVYLLLGRQKDHVRSVSKTVDAELASGTKPEGIISNLRHALKDVVSKMEQDTNTLSELSYKDGLTGLANRRSFDVFLEETVEKWRYEKIPASILLLDIDHFKNFNDEYGHIVGDQVLKMFASQLRNITAAYDTQSDSELLVARYGGEEFVVLLRGPLSSVAAELAEVIRKSIEVSQLRLRGPDGLVVQEGIRVTVSIGVAEFNPDWKSAYGINLIDSADKALYMAKNNGRNRVYMYLPSDSVSFISVPVNG